MRRLVLLLLVGLFAGCQPSAPSGGSAFKAKYRIAVIPKGTSHEFWKSVHYGAVQAGDEFGAQILWQGPLLEDDREQQINVVQNFITKKVDGICLAPLDSQSLVGPVEDAQGEGVPVVIFDSALADDSATVSYVATDNLRGGMLAGEEMAKRLGGKGNVILLRYASGSESTEQREEGFLAALDKHPEIKVISSDQYGGTTPEKALDRTQNLLNKFQGQVNGFFAVCESNATGALKAIEDAGLADKIVFIGFDPNETMVNALSEGRMKGIVLQDPVKMGYLAVKAMIEHLEGGKVERRISTGEAIATPENMNEAEMQTLLKPAQFGE